MYKMSYTIDNKTGLHRRKNSKIFNFNTTRDSNSLNTPSSNVLLFPRNKTPKNIRDRDKITKIRAIKKFDFGNLNLPPVIENEKYIKDESNNKVENMDLLTLKLDKEETSKPNSPLSLPNTDSESLVPMQPNPLEDNQNDEENNEESENSVSSESSLEMIFINLDLISRIKEHDKLTHDDRLLKIQNYSYTRKFIRWYNEDSRDKTIEFLNKVVNDVMETTSAILEEELDKNTLQKSGFDEENSSILRRLSTAMGKSIIGLENLKVTYTEDDSLQTRIDNLITKLNMRIDKVNNLLKIKILD